MKRMTGGQWGSPPHLLILVILLTSSSASAPAQTKKPPREPVQLLWERSSPAIRAMALSPEGAVLATLVGVAPRVALRSTRMGERSVDAPVTAERSSAKLRVYDRSGGVLWERWVDGCSRLVIGRAGTLVGAYSPDTHLFRTLFLWDGRGRREGIWTFVDPIRAVLISPSAPLVIVGTVGGEVILLRRSGAGWERTSWRSSPPIRQMALGAGGTLLLLSGTPIVLGQYDPAGRMIWQAGLRVGTPPGQVRGDSARLSANGTGQFFAIAAEDARDGAGEVQLWSARGRQLWRAPLTGRAPSLLIADAGSRLIVAYDRLVPLASTKADRPVHASRPYYERAMACFDEAGVERWSKGGAFFSPLLVALEARGDWALALSPPARFRLLGRAGETRWRSTFPAPIQVAVASRNGRCAAAYRTDGQLVFLGMSNE